MKKILNYKEYFLNESVFNIKTTDEYELVKATTLWRYKEFDRSENVSNIDSLKSKLLKDGFTEPLILQYSHKYKTAYLIEGNHRLLAAIQSGIEYVPVRVTIDGYENKEAEPVVGYYSKSDKVDVRLPSQIGIPDCLDKDGNPIKSETRILGDENIQEDIDYDEILSTYKDVEKFEEVEDGCYNIWLKMNWWDIHNFMSSETFNNVDAMLNNKKYDVLINFKKHIYEYMNGYFTDEMKDFLNISDYSNEDLNIYFDEEFIYSKYFDKYCEEVSNIIWEKYKEKNINNFLYGKFSTPYDGIIEWVLNKPYLYETFNYKGIYIKHELLECYENEYFENETFLSVLKIAYKNAEIFDEWKIENLKYSITPNMLDFKNIFV